MGRFESGTFSEWMFCMCIEFSLEGIRNYVYMNLYEIPRAVLDRTKFRGIT